MDTIVVYAIWAAIILTGLGALAMVLFGVRSLINGKIDPLSAVMVLAPGVLLVVLGFVMGDWALAGIWTLIVVFAMGILALFLSGVRGLFT